ncbi:hypothetical protein RJ640_009126 [Escallonia rubra]|uniref:Glucan endo-1,3-beta-D-glucosidase n=1 Tax=Escallonia rubra TaxID=112253 RepID=A0AA88QU69_9ASTE|nr:hypothetical protein RJ640_009126 [Escallonia rubra]
MNAQIGITEAKIGVCYGMDGNNLPSYADVVNLYKKYGISNVIETLPSESRRSRGTKRQNFVSRFHDIPYSYISVGNDAIPGEYAVNVAPAMRNIQNALEKQGRATVRVTTVVSWAALANSFPPWVASVATFAPEAREAVVQVLCFLEAHGSQLMINVYPYHGYASDPVNLHQEYAVFTAPGPVIYDGSLGYQNLFDMMVDSFYWAMEKESHGNVTVVVSETGWPSAGNGDLTNAVLAQAYNKGFVQHISSSGTPKRPNVLMDGFLFAMFNENLKPGGVEQNFGLLYPNMTEVYTVFPPRQ